jgi:peptide/nickel transport system permease protein
MATRPVTDFELEGPAAFEEEAEREHVAGIGPWKLAFRRLRRNRTALFFAALFVLMIALCAAAPLYEKTAGIGPLTNNLAGQIDVDGKRTDVVSVEGVPIGPTWQKEYFLGADTNGRDVAVRLLYGGRNSLMIGIGAALITSFLAVVLGLLAGFFRGLADSIIRPALDIIWAFPAILLAVALGTALALGGLKIGPIELAGNSKLIPTLVIAVVYTPYMARPIRGQVLGLREKEFVEAARAQGMSPLRTLFSEVMPNLASTIIVFFPIMVANAILLEAAISFLGAGVQPPEPSWGNMIDAGVDRMITAPHQAIVPGLMLVLTVLSLNVFGDGVRDAFDPRAKVRVEH